MHFPKVSIVIPLFNSEDFIGSSLESAIKQTWPNKEIIVIDDGSTDSSLSIAKTFQNDIVKIVSQKNQGASSARNVGLEMAKGKYIQFLDADDILSLKKVESQVEALERLPHGYVGSCAWKKFEKSMDRAELTDIKVLGDFTPMDWLLTSWEGGGMMANSCWLCPISVIKKAGPWDTNLSLHDDGEFFARVLIHSFGVKFSCDAFVYYRNPSPKNQSQQKKREDIESFLSVCDSYKEHGLSFEDSRRVRHGLMMNYLRFIYETHPKHKDLISNAYQRIADLGFVRIGLYGGRYFKFVARFLGFKNTLRLRSYLKIIKNSLGTLIYREKRL